MSPGSTSPRPARPQVSSALRSAPGGDAEQVQPVPTDPTVPLLDVGGHRRCRRDQRIPEPTIAPTNQRHDIPQRPNHLQCDFCAARSANALCIAMASCSC
jgi:hypothetical protein